MAAFANAFEVHAPLATTVFLSRLLKNSRGPAGSITQVLSARPTFKRYFDAMAAIAVVLEDSNIAGQILRQSGWKGTSLFPGATAVRLDVPEQGFAAAPPAAASTGQHLPFSSGGNAPQLFDHAPTGIARRTVGPESAQGTGGKRDAGQLIFGIDVPPPGHAASLSWQG
jgi:hypothetical protein